LKLAGPGNQRERQVVAEDSIPSLDVGVWAHRTHHSKALCALKAIVTPHASDGPTTMPSAVSAKRTPPARNASRVAARSCTAIRHARKRRGSGSDGWP